MTREEEIIERIRDIGYWEGNGEALVEWVTLGYVEDGTGRRTNNPNWTPLRDSGGDRDGEKP